MFNSIRLKTEGINCFKNQFTHEFVFVDDWITNVVYKANEKVYLPNEDCKVYNKDENTIYKATQQTTEKPSRQSQTGEWEVVDDLNLVSSDDINKAYNESCSVYNKNAFKEESQQILGLNYLVAHFLVIDKQRASQQNKMATNNSGVAGFITSRSVESTSISAAQRKWAMNDPTNEGLLETAYGRKYLTMVANYNYSNSMYISRRSHDCY